MSGSVARTPDGQGPPAGMYVVLDDDDRVTYVSPGLRDELGRWIGHVLWDHLPTARSVYEPCFEEARTTGHATQATVFYAGCVKRLTAVPAADGLTVHVERLAELDVTTLGTLAQSLRRIETALGESTSLRSDPRALGSLRALP